MTLFRPCIDLHLGEVKQIVGGSLGAAALHTNFTSEYSSGHYAKMYKEDTLFGGHVIKLGPGNDAQALEALSAYPLGMQIGGGINLDNAARWLNAGASHVIVTSYLFSQDGRFLIENLEKLVDEVGSESIVVDLSCRQEPEGGWRVAMNRWQTPTDMKLTASTLQMLEGKCAELLVHAADVEGKCDGMDEQLITFLGAESPMPVTYAGGAKELEDLQRVADLSQHRVDLTIGSALDIFGGSLIKYAECVEWNRNAGRKASGAKSS